MTKSYQRDFCDELKKLIAADETIKGASGSDS